MPAEAAASAASTRRSTWSAVEAVLLTEAVDDPVGLPAKAMTVTVLPCITPLVVRVLLAQRRFALVLDRTITTQSSDREAARACSTSSWGVMSGSFGGRTRRWC